MKKVGHEIMLTVGGHWKFKESNVTESIDDDSNFSQFRQLSYDNDNGCVWLSAYLLLNFVDTSISKKISNLMNRIRSNTNG